jgi:RimJ/RimL family protein N-acetyltransferase
VDDKYIIHLLTKWRKQHEWWFPAQFKVALEGTARWLINGVVEAPDRLLFMIRLGDAYIGHVGLFRFNFEKRVCEIDNIVRGEDGHKGIMGSAIVHMMRWGSEYLGLRGYDLQTFSDNGKSLALYTRLGFTEVKRVPLVRVEEGDRIEWSEAPADFAVGASRYNVFMELTDFDEAWRALGK